MKSSAFCMAPRTGLSKPSAGLQPGTVCVGPSSARPPSSSISILPITVAEKCGPPVRQPDVPFHKASQDREITAGLDQQRLIAALINAQFLGTAGNGSSRGAAQDKSSRQHPLASLCPQPNTIAFSSILKWFLEGVKKSITLTTEARRHRGKSFHFSSQCLCVSVVRGPQ